MSILRYTDCDNKDDSIESLVKRTVVKDEDGNLYFRVCLSEAGAIPVSILTEIECNDEYKFWEAIVRKLLAYDEDGNLCWMVYE